MLMEIRDTHMASREFGLLKNALFYGVRSVEPQNRVNTVESIKATFIDWAKNLQDGENRKTLELHLLIILRMSINCPYANVRHNFKELLRDLESQNVSIPSPIYPYPSFYIPPEETFEWPDDSESSEPIGIVPDVDVQNLMIENFIDIGRLSNHFRVLFYFPAFAKSYMNSYKGLVRFHEGALSIPETYYFGIMAASQHKCQYLVSHLTNEYLIAGGNPSWLDGLNFAPPKIKKIAKINSILAHQPWCLEAEHIHELCRGDESWQIQQVIHIIIIICIFHSSSSYLLGCGIVPEYDSVGGYRRPSVWTLPSLDPENATNANGSDSPGDPGDDILVDEENKNELETEEIPDEEIPGDPGDNENHDIPVDEENNNKLETEEIPGEEIPFDVLINDFSHYLDPAVEVSSSKFVLKKNEHRHGYKYHRSQDFSWWEHGVSLINFHFNDNLNLGNILNEEFREIRKMTEDEYEHGLVNEAIRYYVLRLYGIQKDDFIYHKISEHLDNETRVFIKKVCCKPEDITLGDWNSMRSQRNAKEVCSIILISSETRKLAALVYGLRSVNNWIRMN
ncbi:10860_t:CDS:2 [Acaulospora morrowiae]|uniref:10860_t:CDS:1 n=1 Tax=Acaulospora morrowiae TaxID=94023 RepID=A0A9N8WG61_9GLOM|nr:10860_t:CDS:2 [Acaulospora morrowiae]